VRIPHGSIHGTLRVSFCQTDNHSINPNRSNLTCVSLEPVLRLCILPFVDNFILRSVDACFVPSDALNRAARQRGLQPSQIKQYGLPIRQGFWATTTETGETTGSAPQNSANRAGLRQTLGLNVNQPVVLVVGGGDGMGGLVDISRQLGQALGSSDANTKSQLVVVCGKNQQAKQQLDGESDQWGVDVNVMVQGFVNNMDEWMRASDVLVTKAGPGTIAEASICGLPCMMFSFL
jgi:1,2-diacylglycerol 3-beta-galactosyltransferase